MVASVGLAGDEMGAEVRAKNVSPHTTLGFFFRSSPKFLSRLLIVFDCPPVL